MKTLAVTIATTTARRQSDQNGRRNKEYTDMAKVIEFYVPSSYKKKARWVPESLRGKVIDFPAELKKPA